MKKFENMATKIRIGWRLEELVNGEVGLPIEYVVHQAQVRIQSEVDQSRQTQYVEPSFTREMPGTFY